jgi:hypothetical protein
MADLVLTSTDGKVSMDFNVGLGGLHKITETASGKTFLIDKQTLIDQAAPALLAYASTLPTA